MTYYGHRTLFRLLYVRFLGIDDDGIEYRGKRYRWSQIKALKAFNTDLGMIVRLGEDPRAEIHLDDKAVIVIWPTRFVEEHRKPKRSFFRGITDAYDAFWKTVCSRSGVEPDPAGYFGSLCGEPRRQSVR